jgi:hypothetical protein
MADTFVANRIFEPIFIKLQSWQTFASMGYDGHVCNLTSAGFAPPGGVAQPVRIAIIGAG